MNNMIKILRVYNKSIGLSILPVNSMIRKTQDEQNEHYWLAAMGMYETLNIAGIDTVR